MSEGFEKQFLDAKKSSRTVRRPKQVASIGAIQQSIIKHFAQIKDPRVERLRETLIHRYFSDCDFSDCDFSNHSWGARVGRHRELWSTVQQQWLEEFLALPNGIPSMIPIDLVFEFIELEVLNRCFLSRVDTLCYLVHLY